MTFSLPPEQRRAVVLHIGTGKTGTTSLQARMHRNRDRLAELGVLYPESPGRRRHVRLGLAVRPEAEGAEGAPEWRRQSHATPAELRPAFEEQLFAELRTSPARQVLLSDESLYGTSEGAIRTLRELLDRFASTVRVVVYLRRQDDHLCSRYQQLVKRVGEVRRLADRVDEVDFTDLYDYRGRLRTWERLMHPDDLVVRLFERSRFPDGSLHRDFLDAAGLGIRPEQLDEVPVRNESLDAESVELLRLLNIVFGGDHGAVADLLGRTRGYQRLQRASSGPTLTLPESRLDAFMAQWADCNRAVARDFLPDAPDALFVDPRKVQGTTTEQLLDPARVDHFADLLELPSRVRRSLGEVAEREAHD